MPGVTRIPIDWRGVSSEAEEKLKKQKEVNKARFFGGPRKSSSSKPKESGATSVSSEVTIESVATFDQESFLSALMGENLYMADIRASQTQRFVSVPMRLPITLDVDDKDVEQPDSSAFSQVQTIEPSITTFSLDSRLRLLDFYEDAAEGIKRPPYHGTVSHTSREITPRNPLCRVESDTQLIDYDNDSLDDWSEHRDDAESLGSMEDDDDGEPDGLEYNDFFRRDGDMGSDVDSDGEELAVTSSRSRRETPNAVGPFFISRHGASIPSFTYADAADTVSTNASSNSVPLIATFDGMTTPPPTEAGMATLKRFQAVIMNFRPRGIIRLNGFAQDPNAKKIRKSPSTKISCQKEREQAEAEEKEKLKKEKEEEDGQLIDMCMRATADPLPISAGEW